MIPFRKFVDKVRRRVDADQNGQYDPDDMEAFADEVRTGLCDFTTQTCDLFLPPTAFAPTVGATVVELASLCRIVEPRRVWMDGGELEAVGYHEFESRTGATLTGSVTSYAHLGAGQIVLDGPVPSGAAWRASGWAVHPYDVGDDDPISLPADAVDLASMFVARTFMEPSGNPDALARLARYEREVLRGVQLRKSRSLARFYAGMGRGEG